MLDPDSLAFLAPADLFLVPFLAGRLAKQLLHLRSRAATNVRWKVFVGRTSRPFQLPRRKPPPEA